MFGCLCIFSSCPCHVPLIASFFLSVQTVFVEFSLLPPGQVFAERAVLSAKLKLINETKMIDCAEEQWKVLNDGKDVPADFEQRRTQIWAEISDAKARCGEDLLKLAQDVKAINELKADHHFNMEYLAKNMGITYENLEALYAYAQLSYAIGAYGDAADFLCFYRLLSTNDEKNFWALWGRLAADTLYTSFEQALDDLNQLRSEIDQRIKTPHADQLQQRTWIIHWSLFVFFHINNGANKDVDITNGLNQLIEFFFQPELLNAIQINCPHILRYLTAAIIINHKRQQKNLRDICKVIEQEREWYSDPVTEFIRCLFNTFDFDDAHYYLRECETLLENDFFLASSKDEFMEAARLMLFETYCRIHKCTDIKTIAAKLDVPVGESEKKIVEFISQVRVDAKIDSENDQIVMGTRYPSVYKQVIEKTKGLINRGLGQYSK